jgi:hypothetical protein
MQRHVSFGDRDEVFAIFYFDKQRSESIATGAAWRAILVQLLHQMSAFDPDTIDVFLLFRESRASSQPIASDKEVFSILKLLVQRLSRMALVVDGIDECVDPGHFLQQLSCLLDGSVRISGALFNRPTVPLPTKLEGVTTTLSLSSVLNYDGIKMFIGPIVLAMVNTGLLPSSNEPHETTSQITKRANGMFLWATLFMGYLQSEYISVRERSNAIRDMNRLEGLDSLYAEILDRLVQRSTGGARANMSHAFELVLHSFRPLHIDELQYAIAVPMDRRIDEEDRIPHLGKKIAALSGALMEIDHSGFVRFVHLSAMEYLMDATRQGSVNVSRNEFWLDEDRCHRSIACRCLSYLTHSVTSGPLAGSPSITPKVEEQSKRYPLLDYATEYWSFHVLKCLESGTSHQQDGGSRRVVELASKYLSNHHMIMVWIEACWMFGRPPQIRHGPSDRFFKAGARAPRADAGLEKTWKSAWNALSQLSHDLDSINASWGNILRNEPNEIWEPSISAFHQSPFWKRVSGAYIAATFNARSMGGRRSLCVKTQLSQAGERVGLVRLYAGQEDEMPSNVVFESWSIHPNVKLREVDLEVLRSCMKPFVYQGGLSRFQFPVAITADFERVAAPGCVISIPSEEAQAGQIPICDATQYIDFTGNTWRNGSFKFAIEDLQLNYDIQISATGHYLMTIHRSQSMVDVSKRLTCHIRFINIYQDVSTTSSHPAYKQVASLAFKPSYVNPNPGYSTGYPTEYQETQGCALLHPKYPIVAFSCDGIVIIRSHRGETELIDNNRSIKACLWRFEVQGTSLTITQICP